MDDIKRFPSNWIRNGIAYLVIFVLFCFEAAFLPHALSSEVKLSLIPAAIFYIGLSNPGLLPFLVVFALGLVTDFMSDAPAGLHALYYYLILLIAHWQRRYLSGQTFFVSWLAYGFIVLTGQILLWIGYSLYLFTWLRGLFILENTLYGLFIFPLVVLLFHMILKYQVEQDSL